MRATLLVSMMIQISFCLIGSLANRCMSVSSDLFPVGCNKGAAHTATCMGNEAPAGANRTAPPYKPRRFGCVRSLVHPTRCCRITTSQIAGCKPQTETAIRMVIYPYAKGLEEAHF